MIPITERISFKNINYHFTRTIYICNGGGFYNNFPGHTYRAFKGWFNVAASKLVTIDQRPLIYQTADCTSDQACIKIVTGKIQTPDDGMGGCFTILLLD